MKLQCGECNKNTLKEYERIKPEGVYVKTKCPCGYESEWILHSVKEIFGDWLACK